MELMALALLLGVSVVGNAFLFRELQSARRHYQAAERVSEAAAKAHAAELEKARKAPAPTLTAEALLHDLTAGGAVVRIERLNPADLFLRSPRT